MTPWWRRRIAASRGHQLVERQDMVTMGAGGQDAPPTMRIAWGTWQFVMGPHDGQGGP
jgi:hypothetical protein